MNNLLVRGASNHVINGAGVSNLPSAVEVSFRSLAISSWEVAAMVRSSSRAKTATSPSRFLTMPDLALPGVGEPINRSKKCLHPLPEGTRANAIVVVEAGDAADWLLLPIMAAAADRPPTAARKAWELSNSSKSALLMRRLAAGIRPPLPLPPPPPPPLLLLPWRSRKRSIPLRECGELT